MSIRLAARRAAPSVWRGKSTAAAASRDPATLVNAPDVSDSVALPAPTSVDNATGTISAAHQEATWSADAIQAALPAAEALLLDDCQHSPHREQKEEVLSRLAAFAARCGGGGPAL